MVVDFKTEKGDWSFVKMNNNCVEVEIDCKIYTSIYDVTNGISGPIISNQEIDISIVGFVKDLTEEDWEKVVDMDYGLEDTGCYVDYTKGKNYLGYWSYYTFFTAKESGESLMESLEVYLENPVSYPENPEDQGWIDAWQHCGELTGNWIIIEYN